MAFAHHFPAGTCVGRPSLNIVMFPLSLRKCSVFNVHHHGGVPVLVVLPQSAVRNWKRHDVQSSETRAQEFHSRLHDVHEQFVPHFPVCGAVPVPQVR